uniref:WXG100 family type VII secretion target n=1 Tax=Gordonia sp. B7-2 TaxID=3420932 RepID=UPI003D8E09D0
MLNLPGIGSAGPGVALNVADAQATAQAVASIVDDMKETIGVIARHAGNATPTWQGRAGVAFDGTHTDWNRAAITLNNLLDQIRTQLSQGFAGYEDQDASAANGLAGGPVSV